MMSLHRTIGGAYKAMKEHKLREYHEWRDRPNQYRKSFKAGIHQDWMVRQVEIKD